MTTEIPTKTIVHENGEVEIRPMTPEEIAAFPPAPDLPDLPSVFDNA